ncbi:MAG: DNA polymerase III subunit gamma/tau [Puniceicoccales bacterium]|jgi:DNA polymerase-3 subunit gamma/tau|nr:DNA polymerase III subunit gamma/tau [Puniceicoccales bacterium]
MSEGTYQVIARRWRPQQFDEIVGQEHIVRTLKNAIETNRIGHAYLFVGPRGTGKTTTARIFAKALNCTDGPKVSPPSDDPVCNAIVAGSCLDVVEIDAATNRSIEDAKLIREACQYAPAECKFKIFIIDEIHQLSKDAFNALLKTLEEPPEHIKFIFATTEVEKLLPTIISRCQRFEFLPIPEKQIAGRLAEIVAADGVEASEDALLAIARLANGGMRDSQSILDQAISFCGKKITAVDVANIYGLVPAADIEALASAMAAGDFAGVVALVDRFSTEGRDLHRALQDTQARVRGAMLDAIRSGGKTAVLGAPLATEQLLRMLETLQAGEHIVRNGLSVRAAFEVTLLKAVEQSRARAIDTLIKEIASLSADLPTEAGEKKIDWARPADIPPAAPIPRAAATPAAVPAATSAVASAANAIAHTASRPAAPSAPPSPAAAPPPSAFDDGPPLEALGGADEFAAGNSFAASADFADNASADSASASDNASGDSASSGSFPPPALPESEDFKQAVAALPEKIRHLLDERFHAEFIVLAGVPKRRLLTPNAPKPVAAPIVSDASDVEPEPDV